MGNAWGDGLGPAQCMQRRAACCTNPHDEHVELLNPDDNELRYELPAGGGAALLPQEPALSLGGYAGIGGGWAQQGHLVWDGSHAAAQPIARPVALPRSEGSFLALRPAMGGVPRSDSMLLRLSAAPALAPGPAPGAATAVWAGGLPAGPSFGGPPQAYACAGRLPPAPSFGGPAHVAGGVGFGATAAPAPWGAPMQVAGQTVSPASCAQPAAGVRTATAVPPPAVQRRTTPAATESAYDLLGGGWMSSLPADRQLEGDAARKPSAKDELTYARVPIVMFDD